MKTHTRSVLALGSALSFIFLATGCTSGGDADFSDAETTSEDFPYDGHKLTIDAGTAELVLVSGSSDAEEVKVDQQITGTANNESPETQRELDGDTLNLSVDCNGLSLGCKGRFTVTVPEGVAVDAHNKNSQIDASDFSTDLTVSAVNGDADLERISNPKLTLTGKDMVVEGTDLSSKAVSTDTRNGDINLMFSEAPDRVKINSKDGDVRLSLPETDYRVDVTTKKGKEDVSVSTSDTSEHVISVTTRNGDVDIVPAS